MRPIGMILAAGLGTRLWPLTHFRPKPMMEVLGKPIIYHLIKTMEDAHIKDIIINLHFKAHDIAQYIAHNRFNARIHLIYEKTILGTAGAIKNAITKLDIKHRSMVVMHGDILCDLKLKPYLDHDHYVLLIGSANQAVFGYDGKFSLNHKGDITELGSFYKVSSHHHHHQGFFTGIHMLSHHALAKLLSSNESNLVASIYPQWLALGYKIKGLMLPLCYDDLGTKERLFNANMSLLHKLDSSNNIYISPSAHIANTSTIKGPVMIGDHVVIKDHVSIGPNVVIGDRALVNSHSIIKDAIIFSDTLINHENLVGKIALSWARISIGGDYA